MIGSQLETINLFEDRMIARFSGCDVGGFPRSISYLVQERT